MKQKNLLFSLLIMLLFLSSGGYWLFQSRRSKTIIPRYLPLASGYKLPPYDHVFFSFLNDDPFAHDKLWVTIYSESTKAPAHRLLLDLKQNRLLGELHHGNPEAFDPSGQKVLVSVHDYSGRQIASPNNRFMDDMLHLLHLPPRGSSGTKLEKINYYLLDLQTNQATFLETLMEQSGSGSTGHPSPSGRFFYQATFHGQQAVFDLVAASSKRLPDCEQGNDYSSGWLTDEEMLVKDQNRGVMQSLDRATGNRSDLVTPQMLIAALTPHLPSGHVSLKNPTYYVPQKLAAPASNRHLVRCYDPQGMGVGEPPMPLLELTSGTKPLRLLSPAFPVRRTGTFNHDASAYLYSGEGETNDSNAVYIYDIPTSQTRTLVPGDPNKKYFNLCRFWGDQVIYVQENKLYAIPKTGGQPRQLFPPG